MKDRQGKADSLHGGLVFWALCLAVPWVVVLAVASFQLWPGEMRTGLSYLAAGLGTATLCYAAFGKPPSQLAICVAFLALFVMLIVVGVAKATAGHPRFAYEQHCLDRPGELSQETKLHVRKHTRAPRD